MVVAKRGAKAKRQQAKESKRVEIVNLLLLLPLLSESEWLESSSWRKAVSWSEGNNTLVQGLKKRTKLY